MKNDLDKTSEFVLLGLFIGEDVIQDIYNTRYKRELDILQDKMYIHITPMDNQIVLTTKGVKYCNNDRNVNFSALVKRNNNRANVSLACNVMGEVSKNEPLLRKVIYSLYPSTQRKIYDILKDDYEIEEFLSIKKPEEIN